MHKIALDKENHVYTVDGKECPGVTTILRDQGILVISDFSTGPELGLEVHSAVEAFNLGFYDPSVYSLEIAPYMKAYKAFKLATNFQPDGVEQIIYNELLGYCGTLDSTGLLNGKFSLVDLKTGVENPATVVQIAAYRAAHPEGNNIAAYSLHLKNDGKYKLNRIQPQELLAAWNLFVGALSTWKFRQKHGLL